MELRFVPPQLASLDALEGEVLVCPVWSDERPSHGVAGLLDWRLGGRLSSLQRRGLITGEVGETVLLPGRPRLVFDKLLLFGAGERAAFGEELFHRLVLEMLRATAELATRAPVLELPGRHDKLIAAERAADILLACAGREREHHVFTLVEDSEGKQRIMQHMIEERRRVRRVL